MMFIDRADAGRQLARHLAWRRGEGVVVLGVPCSGVIVAYQVARELAAPLDVIVVRRLRAPTVPRAAFGAVAEGGQALLDPERVARVGLDEDALAALVARERREVERWAWRLRAPTVRPTLSGKHVVVVDDGAALGDRVRAALRSVLAQRPATVTAAVPVLSEAALAALRGEADSVVYVDVPPDFFTVGYWYAHGGFATDEDVVALLGRARQEELEHRRAPSACSRP